MFLFNFHHVEPVPRHEDRRHITITPRGLGRFIDLLRLIGLEPVSLKTLVAQGGPGPHSHRQAMLTFDDGFENFYRYAAPVLAEKRCPSTVFVLAGKFSGHNDWDQGALHVDQRDALLSLDQLHSLASADIGVTFGSHGLYHQDLTTLNETALRAEILDSYQILQSALGDAFVPVMAYPWGRVSESVVHMMERSPYQFGMTTEKGSWTPESAPYEVPRHSAYYRDGNPLILLAKLARYRMGIFGLPGRSAVDVSIQRPSGWNRLPGGPESSDRLPVS